MMEIQQSTVAGVCSRSAVQQGRNAGCTLDPVVKVVRIVCTIDCACDVHAGASQRGLGCILLFCIART